MGEYNKCDVDHPRIRDAVRIMKKRGYDKEAISKKVGMPYEVVDRHYQKSGKPLQRQGPDQ